VMSIIHLTTPGLRVWGMVGIVYAIIVPIFGVLQSNLLVGHLHWLIQTLHMLDGIGALVLTGFLAARSMQLQRNAMKSTPGSQALH